MEKRKYWAYMAVAVLLAGCGDSRTPEQKAGAWSADAGVALGEAKAAAEKGNAKGARRAADRAKEDVKQLEALVAKNPGATFAALVEPARAAAREAADVAGLAENKAYVADRVGSLKARAYRGTESLAITAFCQAGALACDQAAKRPTSELPGPVRNAAESAAELDQALTGRAPKADGSPDYPAIAAAMRAFSAAPPEEMHLLLAAAHVGSASNDLALVEIEQVDPAKLSKDLRFLYRVERMAIYRMHRLDYLAKQELRDATAAGENVAWFTPQVQAGMHLVLAVSYFQEKDYKAADLEVARAVQLDPNNPVTVFLTGERLLAEGKRAEVAESLEKTAAGSGHEWVAKLVAERVRELRDSSEQPEPILLSGAFFRSVLVHYLKEGSTGAGKAVGNMVTDIQGKLEGALKGSAATVPAATAGKP